MSMFSSYSWYRMPSLPTYRIESIVFQYLWTVPRDTPKYATISFLGFCRLILWPLSVPLRWIPVECQLSADILDRSDTLGAFGKFHWFINVKQIQSESLNSRHAEKQSFHSFPISGFFRPNSFYQPMWFQGFNSPVYRRFPDKKFFGDLSFCYIGVISYEAEHLFIVIRQFFFITPFITPG